MRITLLANRDVHAAVALNLLQPSLVDHEVTLFLSESVGRPRPGYVAPEGLQQLKFLEGDLFTKIIAPLAERQPTEGRFLTFRELGRHFGRAARVLHNPNKGSGLEQLTESRPDLVVSIRYGRILRDAAIRVPRLGVLNLHSGLLPRYQGILTTLHSLIEDQGEVGCTLHRIDSAAIDAGPVVGRATVPVDRRRSLFRHVQQLYPAGCRLIADAIDALSAGREPSTAAQVQSEQVYYGLPEPEHFEALQCKGFGVWHGEDVEEVYRSFLVDPASRDKYDRIA